jgi:hypothetical protein
MLCLGSEFFRPEHLTNLPARKSDAGALRGWTKPSATEHRSGFGRLFGELGNSIHQLLGRRTLLPGVLDYHHESDFLCLLFDFEIT